MNLKDRIQIELQRQDNELLREALEYVDAQSELEALYNTLAAHDLPIDSKALDKALTQAQAEYASLNLLYDGLSDRYDKMSDIAESYAEISNDLLYKV
jgi:hypothetical protein